MKNKIIINCYVERIRKEIGAAIADNDFEFVKDDMLTLLAIMDVPLYKKKSLLTPGRANVNVTALRVLCADRWFDKVFFSRTLTVEFKIKGLFNYEHEEEGEENDLRVEVGYYNTGEMYAKITLTDPYWAYQYWNPATEEWVNGYIHSSTDKEKRFPREHEIPDVLLNCCEYME